MKRMVIIIIMACFIAALSIQGALAGQWIGNATVTEVGMGSGAVYVKLTDPSVNISNRWYIADSNNQNVILAVALTAISSGQSVQASVSTLSQYGTLSAIYILPQQ
jgi:Gpi18-like mannosyltransferase